MTGDVFAIGTSSGGEAVLEEVDALDEDVMPESEEMSIDSSVIGGAAFGFGWIAKLGIPGLVEVDEDEDELEELEEVQESEELEELE